MKDEVLREIGVDFRLMFACKFQLADTDQAAHELFSAGMARHPDIPPQEPQPRSAITYDVG